jgi:SprT protein
MNTEEMQEKLASRCKELVLQACARYNLTPRGLDVRYDKKGGGGGTAGYDKPTGRYYLNFNMELALRNEAEYMNQVVPHEVSHINDFWKNPSPWGHGDHWSRIMFDFGVYQERTHNMDTTGIKHKQSRSHIYHCPRCGHIFHLTTRTHNAVLSGRLRVCGHCTCKPVIVYDGDEPLELI